MQEQDSTVHLAATCPVCGSTGYEANSPCPLHAAAPVLLAALEREHEAPGCETTVTLEPCSTCAVIAQAKGEVS